MDKPKKDDQVIIFLLNGDKFGISVANLIEVSKLSGLRKGDAKGIYEGKLILRSHEAPVINLGMLFHLDEVKDSENVRILVLERFSKLVGLKVEAVSEVIAYSLKSIRPMPKMIMDSAVNYFIGIGRVNGEPVIFLNDEEIIAEASVGKN